MKKSLMSLIVLLSFCLLPISGLTWSALKRLTWNSGMSISPSIDCSSISAIHLVWEDDSSGNFEIYYKNSNNGGTTWSAPERLTWNTGLSEYPCVASYPTYLGGSVHVVWHDDTPGKEEIYYKRSTDGGTTWSGLSRLTWNDGWSLYPSIAIDSGGVVRLIWYDHTPGNYEIFYKHSLDGGTTWSVNKRLTWTSDNSGYPDIACSSASGIHVVWVEYLASGNAEIYYKNSTDGGTTWSAPARLTWNSGSSGYPAIATDLANGVHVVWSDNTPGNDEIFYKGSTDGGTTWSAPTRLTWSSGKSYSQDITSDSNNNIHVAWSDSVAGNLEIFYKYSTDSGSTWSGNTRLTWNSENSSFPSIVVDPGGGIQVVWQDDTPGNREIFYKNCEFTAAKKN